MNSNSSQTDHTKQHGKDRHPDLAVVQRLQCLRQREVHGALPAGWQPHEHEPVPHEDGLPELHGLQDVVLLRLQAQGNLTGMDR